MEPLRLTPDPLLAVQAELIKREPIFHRPELGTTREVFETATDPAFWEVGASGRRYSRQYVIDTVVERYSGPYPDEWQTQDFCCQALATDLYLLTYTLLQGPRVTRRSTIWRRGEAGWLIVFHQGTVVEGVP